MKRHIQDWTRFSINEDDSQIRMSLPMIRDKSTSYDRYTKDSPLNVQSLPPGTLCYRLKGETTVDPKTHRVIDAPGSPTLYNELFGFLKTASRHNLKLVLEQTGKHSFTIAFMGSKSDLDGMLSDVEIEVIEY